MLFTAYKSVARLHAIVDVRNIFATFFEYLLPQLTDVSSKLRVTMELGWPSVLVRFACHIPFGMVAFESVAIWSKSRGLHLDDTVKQSDSIIDALGVFGVGVSQHYPSPDVVIREEGADRCTGMHRICVQLHTLCRVDVLLWICPSFRRPR